MASYTKRVAKTIEIGSRWYWFPVSSEKIPAALFAEVDRIDRETVEHQNAIRRAMALYGRPDTWGYQSIVERTIPPHKRIAHNACATASDALASQVTQTVPRPMCITTGGDFRQRRKARKHTHYYDAKFHSEQLRYKSFQAVRDSIVCGLGIIRVFRKHPDLVEEGKDSVGMERVSPLSFKIDDRHCIDELPRQAYLEHEIDRDYACKKWPELASKLKDASGPSTAWQATTYRNTDENRIRLIEAWSLPSSPGADDGRHVIASNNAIILSEKWDCDHFPFAFLRAIPPQRGFWGEKVIMRAETTQFELNKLLRRVQQSMHVHAVPRVFIPKQAGIVKGQIRNNVGIVVEYEGNNPPMFLTPQSIGADVYQHIQLLENWIYKEMGVSELSATSKKPAGLDSGVALRNYNDVQSRRWIHLERSYEELFVRVAELCEYFENQISDEYPEHTVGATHRKFVDSLKWKDIRLDKEIVQVRTYSSSALPNTPAGKLAALEDMVRNQVITPNQFVRMADMPDFEAVRNLVVAPEEFFEDMFDEMLDDPENYRGPEPHINFALGRAIGAKMMAQAEVEGASPADVAIIARWIKQSYDVENWVQKQEAIRQAKVQAEMAAEAAMMNPMSGNPQGPPTAQGPFRQPQPQAGPQQQVAPQVGEVA